MISLVFAFKVTVSIRLSHTLSDKVMISLVFAFKVMFFYYQIRLQNVSKK